MRGSNLCRGRGTGSVGLLDPESPAPPFLPAFTEWVEALSFGEREAAASVFGTLLRIPAGVLLASSLSLLARLLDAFSPTPPADIAAALAEHLVVPGPDPARQALIRDVVAAAGGEPGVAAGHDAEAVLGVALECASFLTQALAERDGVVPSSVLRGL